MYIYTLSARAATHNCFPKRFICRLFYLINHLVWEKKCRTGRPLTQSVIIWRVWNGIQKSTFLTNSTFKQKGVGRIQLLFLILQVVPCGQMLTKIDEQGVQRFTVVASMRQEWKIWLQQMIISITD